MKLTNSKDIKRYLNATIIALDGVLVVERNEPPVPTRHCVIVPRHVLQNLLTALHIQHLTHPTSQHLKLVTQQYLFALDMDVKMCECYKVPTDTLPPLPHRSSSKRFELATTPTKIVPRPHHHPYRYRPLLPLLCGFEFRS